uniref:Uncharacterized protein n=1 Tax=viral metagenome TaxID=1070528 RepID=A0A6M3JY28_9ZZZZ
MFKENWGMYTKLSFLTRGERRYKAISKRVQRLEKALQFRDELEIRVQVANLSYLFRRWELELKKS